VVIVDRALSGGQAVNAAVCVAAAIAPDVPGLLGAGGPAAAGRGHFTAHPPAGPGRDARPGAVEGSDLGEDVDDRLGGQAGNGSAPEVMDPADDPGGDALLQGSALSLELRRPARIRGGDVDGFGFR
jgi:hypothetical protein